MRDTNTKTFVNFPTYNLDNLFDTEDTTTKSSDILIHTCHSMSSSELPNKFSKIMGKKWLRVLLVNSI